LNLEGLRTALTRNRVETDSSHPDPRLRGRTYAIPFAVVWAAARKLTDGGLRGWELVETDEETGMLKAEATTPVFRFVDDVTIRIALDENAQTRVDMSSASRVGKGDLGKNARRVTKFFRSLDREIGAGAGTILDPTIPLRTLVWTTLLLLTGCMPAENVPEATDPRHEEVLSPVRNFEGRVYERHIVFLRARGDSTLVVPWSFLARTRPGGVDRTIRGWLGRGGEWVPFLTERWETPPSRVPWRILPRAPARIIVGEEDALERVFFQEGPRRLEVVLGDLLAEWTGQRAQTIRLHRGTTLLSERQVEGFLLDLSRGRASDSSPSGSWALLVSGDSLQVVLEGAGRGSEEEGETYTAWARLDFTDRRWTDLRLQWEETTPFEAARREVPVSWSLVSPGGDVAGALEAVNPFMEVGPGEGPLLPVEALFEVTGTIVVNEREFPVRGILRHLEGS
jgi:hypothetical protein